MVNVASRLEGLTRFYDEPLLISESIYRRVNTRIACRLVDRVQVKGRSRGFAVYSVRKSLTQSEEQAWKLHDRGVQHYYSREFAEAARYFQGVLRLLPEDPISPIFIQRCRIYEERPPAADWTGIVAYSEK
jgi:adenylate cyclase